MRLAMSFKTRRELLIQLMPRYREASRKQKKFLLDEFVLSTGYSRKYAIRLLSLKKISNVEKISRSRPRYYGSEEQEIIKLAWSAANFISSKRLAPFLKELIPTLERHGYLIVSDDVRDKIISISASTIDRILNNYRKSKNSQGISTTKSGILLKNQITVRTFADWEETSPGFFEGDLVAHCGSTTEGSYLSTLVLTDILTGWTECLPLLFHNQDSVAAALDNAMALIPFPFLGLDTDNGTEFINQTIIDFCENHDITFTRGRAYKKNDQFFVEQKNKIVVRQLVGYDRFEGLRAYQQLNELYRATRLYVNFFQPSMKLRIKKRDGCKVHRQYDMAQTPYRRLLNTGILSLKKKERLEILFKFLDPIRLLQQIKSMQDALWKHAIIEHKESKMINSKDCVTFNPHSCLLNENNNIQPQADDFIKDALESEKRKYRSIRKPRVPHTWRTRKDPFEKVWDDVRLQLEK